MTGIASTRGRAIRRACLSLAALSALLLAACGTPQQNTVATKRTHPKEYFSESAYGVKASPRVSFLKTNLPRGGGRDQTGQPYQVRGKWYYPKEDKTYRKAGQASWYGDAFHGRLTANGEIYDKTHLTAAHPTMPLPSYARVTNTANGSSIIVRVNDRGPYAEGRIIDLSQRAAEMLDYQHTGTAKVVVEYVGRAPLDGNDDRYLMASYQPGNKPLDPSVGLPDGVMIAMNGKTPRGAGQSLGTLAIQNDINGDADAAGMMAAAKADAAGVTLPTLGPVAPQRPASLPDRMLVASAGLSYAADDASAGAGAFRAFDARAATTSGWKAATDEAGFIAVGSYRSAANAGSIAASLSSYGRVDVTHDRRDGAVWHSVSLYPRGDAGEDAALKAAWAAGAPNAFVVHD